MIRIRQYAKNMPFLLLLMFVGVCPANEQHLMLFDVYEMIERENPDIKAYQSALAGAAGGIRQARLLPNPEVGIGLEDFGRETVEIMISQAIEFGDKRGSRVRVAQAEQAIAQIELEAALLRLRSETMSRFGTVIAAKRRVTLVDSLLSLARATKVFTERRVEAGAAMAIDLVRSETALQENELEKRSLETEYLLARKNLAVLWGDPRDVDWEPVETFVCAPLEISLEKIRHAADDHPDLQILEKNILLIEEERSVERSAAFPELTLGAGFLRDNVADESVSLIQASISLPMFNRNQGAVSKKSFEIEQANHLLHSERLTRWAEVERVMGGIAILTERIQILEKSILPNSEQILKVLMDHYQQGAVGILEVLDAQQSLMEKWIEHTEDLSERASLAGELMALTGTECEVIQ